jgi:hypothetical protein
MADPLSFFAIESGIKEFYKDRIPSLTPTYILSDFLSGFRNYKGARQTYHNIIDMCEAFHVQLIANVMNAILVKQDYEANFARKELEFTHELRRRNLEKEADFDFQVRLAKILGKAETRRSDRLHEQAKELLTMQQNHEILMSSARVNLSDPSVKFQKIAEAQPKLREMLREIEALPETNRIKHQMSLALIEAHRQAFS